MRQLQRQAEQDRDDWGAWLKWTPMSSDPWVFPLSLLKRAHGAIPLLDLQTTEDGHHNSTLLSKTGS